MYSVGEIVRGLTKPRSAALELWKVYNRQLRNKTGIDVMEEDWDNLIILDACRYDIFDEMHNLPGTLRPVISQAATSKEFFQQNFGDQDFGDTVYVSANGHLQRSESRFHDRIRLFETDREPLWSDQFDDPPTIVFPERAVKRTLETYEQYPNKRLITHLMQPHSPFLGETGKTMYRRDVNWYDNYERGNITSEQIEQAYRENLELVLPHVERLVSELPGKTVVTADHGELFGYNPFDLSGHPGGVYLRDLVTVPWHEIPANERRDIVEEEATEGPMELTDDVKRSLRDLGYMPE